MKCIMLEELQHPTHVILNVCKQKSTLPKLSPINVLLQSGEKN